MSSAVFLLMFAAFFMAASLLGNPGATASSITMLTGCAVVLSLVAMAVGWQGRRIRALEKRLEGGVPAERQK